jgi:hypothetical protein
MAAIQSAFDTGAPARIAVDGKQHLCAEPVGQRVLDVRRVEFRAGIREVPVERHIAVEPVTDPVRNVTGPRSAMGLVDVDEAECARPRLREVQLGVLFEAGKRLALEQWMLFVDGDRGGPASFGRRAGSGDRLRAHLHAHRPPGLRPGARRYLVGRSCPALKS